LVVVAIIQIRTLWTEAGEGSMPTVFGHGLVGPKGVGNSGYRAAPAASPKGNQVNIPELGARSDGNVHSVNEVGVFPLESFLFSLCPSGPCNVLCTSWGSGGRRAPLFLGCCALTLRPW